MAGRPAKMTSRYSRIRPRTVPVTRIKSRICSEKPYTSAHKIAVTAVSSANEARMPSRRRPMSRCPKQMENTAPLPSDSPSSMEVRNVISVNAEPTAASASAPRKRPTISVSATL